ENKTIALKNAIQEGVESGLAIDFNPNTHLKELKAKKEQNG
ncbi:MAG: type II toxin-antitoxin system ParD family antitoxin, partial [Bacteroidota bacterium]|nr:type II toxin-antitoxin system ParD family antitoxin [Bacteroidota bacterium]